MHEKIKPYRKAKHAKVFSKFLKGIEKDLQKNNAGEFDVVVDSYVEPQSMLDRFLGLFRSHGFDDPEESMLISTVVYGCVVEIFVPIAHGGITMPYFIYVELPVSMQGRAEYRRGALHNKWYYEPKNKQRASQLKNALPKVQMGHMSGNIIYETKIGYILEAKDAEKTVLTISSGYDGGTLTGGYRPRVHKYIEAIPALLDILKNWEQESDMSSRYSYQSSKT